MIDKSKLLDSIIVHFAINCFNEDDYIKFVNYYGNFMINPCDKNFYIIMHFIEYALNYERI